MAVLKYCSHGGDLILQKEPPLCLFLLPDKLFILQLNESVSLSLRQELVQKPAESWGVFKPAFFTYSGSVTPLVKFLVWADLNISIVLNECTEALQSRGFLDDAASG